MGRTVQWKQLRAEDPCVASAWRAGEKVLHALHLSQAKDYKSGYVQKGQCFHNVSFSVWGCADLQSPSTEQIPG